MELALGDGDPRERMDRVVPLVLSLESDDFPYGLRHRFIALRDRLIEGEHLADEERCLELIGCLRELEGSVNPRKGVRG